MSRICLFWHPPKPLHTARGFTWNVVGRRAKPETLIAGGRYMKSGNAGELPFSMLVVSTWRHAWRHLQPWAPSPTLLPTPCWRALDAEPDAENLARRPRSQARRPASSLPTSSALPHPSPPPPLCLIPPHLLRSASSLPTSSALPHPSPPPPLCLIPPHLLRSASSLPTSSALPHPSPPPPLCLIPPHLLRSASSLPTSSALPHPSPPPPLCLIPPHLLRSASSLPTSDAQPSAAG